MLDAPKELDIGGPVIAPAAAALHRLELGKPGFPKAQNVLSNAEIGGNFADIAKRFHCLWQGSSSLAHVAP
jgi:hypothetical protein